MIFDTHAHYDDRAFDEDREELLSGMKEHGIGTIVDCGDHFDGLPDILRLTEEYPFLYAAIGVHPASVASLTDEKLDWIREALKRPKVAAVGEIGLDYHEGPEDKEIQKEWFARQIGLARDAELPVVIHSRDAAADTMELIQKERVGEIGGIMHCYSYSPEQAEIYVQLGLLIGVGGVVTFRNAKKLKETVKRIPLSSIVLETDCPYLAPEPYRGKRNSSLYLPFVARAISELKGVSEEEVIAATEENARRLFRI